MDPDWPKRSTGPCSTALFQATCPPRGPEVIGHRPVGPARCAPLSIAPGRTIVADKRLACRTLLPLHPSPPTPGAAHASPLQQSPRLPPCLASSLFFATLIPFSKSYRSVREPCSRLFVFLSPPPTTRLIFLPRRLASRPISTPLVRDDYDPRRLAPSPVSNPCGSSQRGRRGKCRPKCRPSAGRSLCARPGRTHREPRATLPARRA